MAARQLYIDRLTSAWRDPDEQEERQPQGQVLRNGERVRVSLEMMDSQQLEVAQRFGSELNHCAHSFDSPCQPTHDALSAYERYCAEISDAWHGGVQA